MTRRRFLGTSLGAAAAWPLARAAAALPRRALPLFPDPRIGWRGESSLAASLRAGWVPRASPAAAPRPAERSLAQRFPDAPRHFVFEYYPWYGEGYRHWDQWDRVPPHDIAANHVPALGPYDSLSFAVLEQHARWILEAGAGAVNLSWWGPGSYEDQAVGRVMDVMHAHGIKVTFHLEPYRNDRSRYYVDDVLYLLRAYGERRRFDAFLLLADEDGVASPVLKSFRTILPPEVEDCLGVRYPVPDYTEDSFWARELERLRLVLRADFPRLRLLADTLNLPHAVAGGFDGVAVYDNFVPPGDYRGYAAEASRLGLLYSFNANPGFDTIEPRDVGNDPCYAPTPFAPPAEGLEWRTEQGRARAAALARSRITESLLATVSVQSDLALGNAARGFFLVYLTSFNEWHEGHAFEPMKDYAALSPEEKALGYHNPANGHDRLQALRALIAAALVSVPTPPPPDGGFPPEGGL